MEMSPSYPTAHAVIKCIGLQNIQNCTIQNNSEHIVAYHICRYTLDYSNPGTTFDGTKNEYLGFSRHRKFRWKISIFTSNCLKWLCTKCSARRAVRILLLSVLVYRKKTTPVFPSSHLRNIVFQLLPILPHIPILPRLPLSTYICSYCYVCSMLIDDQ